MKLILVDDHPMVLQGVSSVVNSQKDMKVVGTASNIEEGLRLLRELHPDLAVVDLRIGNDYGLDLIKQGRKIAPSCRFIVLTSFSDGSYIRECLAHKVEGYILKEATPEEFLVAIRLVARGRNYIDPAVMQQIVFHDSHDPIEQLTSREKEVLEALAQGMSNREIAAALYITEYTVKKHVSQILDKLDLADRTQAALYAYSKGMGRSSELSLVV
ncbi:MAG: response regulator transcription factor [Syntrophomonadaceae bacterium]|jgi:two-component system nitrate/nitrite response regulator NarL|nr:response regulator transcription factor [Syntrophomonadaceae bacterium]